jgi:hypothetical protein
VSAQARTGANSIAGQASILQTQSPRTRRVGARGPSMGTPRANYSRRNATRPAQCERSWAKLGESLECGALRRARVPTSLVMIKWGSRRLADNEQLVRKLKRIWKKKNGARASARHSPRLPLGRKPSTIIGKSPGALSIDIAALQDTQRLDLHDGNHFGPISWAYSMGCDKNYALIAQASGRWGTRLGHAWAYVIPPRCA